MSIEFLIFSIFGDLPSSVIFLFCQLYSMSVTLFVGFLNISSFLQLLIIINHKYVREGLKGGGYFFMYRGPLMGEPQSLYSINTC